MSRVRFDLCPTHRNQSAVVERLLALGAVRVCISQGETPYIVVADPSGAEFCTGHAFTQR